MYRFNIQTVVSMLRFNDWPILGFSSLYRTCKPFYRYSVNPDLTVYFSSLPFFCTVFFSSDSILGNPVFCLAVYRYDRYIHGNPNKYTNSFSKYRSYLTGKASVNSVPYCSNYRFDRHLYQLMGVQSVY